MIEVSFPGKLFLMGEYSIMESGQSSVVMSVKQRLKLRLTESKSWRIKSSFGLYEGEDVYTMSSMKEVSAALRTVENFLNKKVGPYSIEITSELDEGDKKYGFGSSGVVIVAVVSALLKQEEIHLSEIELFKLSVLVQKELKNYSSGGDLAAAIFDSVIKFRRYDVNWLNDNTQTIKELVYLDWPLLEIELLDLFKYNKVIIGWTGKSNKTDNFLKKVNETREINSDVYDKFLIKAEESVKRFIGSIDDYAELKESTAVYRALMNELAEWAQIEIETKELNNLIESSLSLGFAAKISGSGGGDCGITIVPKECDEKDLIDLWNKNNIKKL